MNRRLVLVDAAGEAPPPEPGRVVVVLDTAWFPGDGGSAVRDDCISIRPAVARVLDRFDAFDEARVALDQWAAAVELDRATAIDGVAWWHRFRLSLWLRLAQAIHWVRILDALAEAEGPPSALTVTGALPVLAEAARLVGARDGVPVEVTGTGEAAGDPDGPAGVQPGTAGAATAAARTGPGPGDRRRR